VTTNISNSGLRTKNLEILKNAIGLLAMLLAESRKGIKKTDGNGISANAIQKLIQDRVKKIEEKHGINFGCKFSNIGEDIGKAYNELEEKIAELKKQTHSSK
jgi:hypothetical protein